MNERIRELRKHLGINQTEFGEKIGLTQKPVSEMERDGGTVTNRNFNAICKAFSVNPDWLRTGQGEMFLETREALIKSVAEEYELLPEEIRLLRMYLDLPHEYRVGALNFIKNFAAMLEGAQSQSEFDQARYELDRAEESAKKMAEGRTSSASIGTNCALKKFGISP